MSARDAKRDHRRWDRPDLELGATDWSAICLCGGRRRDHFGLEGDQGSVNPNIECDVFRQADGITPKGALQIAAETLGEVAIDRNKLREQVTGLRAAVEMLLVLTSGKVKTAKGQRSIIALANDALRNSARPI